MPFPDARRRGLAESFLPPLPARPSRAAALVAAMQLKDPYTRGHGDRVGEAAALIGAELRLPADALRDLRLAGTLHDIGKLAVPGCLLRKPGPLTPAERETVQRHPRHGYALVCGSEVPAVARVAVLHHHERLDGGGYPHGLAGPHRVGRRRARRHDLHPQLPPRPPGRRRARGAAAVRRQPVRPRRRLRARPRPGPPPLAAARPARHSCRCRHARRSRIRSGRARRRVLPHVGRSGAVRAGRAWPGLTRVPVEPPAPAWLDAHGDGKEAVRGRCGTAAVERTGAGLRPRPKCARLVCVAACPTTYGR